MQDLVVTTIQTALHWEDIQANLAMFDQKIQEIGRADVILLPEMFSTGFSMNAIELAEDAQGKALQSMKAWAAAKQALVMGSVIATDGGHYYNRLYAVKPDGTMQHYDKRHLFRMAKEDETYSPGGEKIIVDWKGWKILPLVCYDLRFPVWSRNTAQNGSLEYDLLVYVANWPAPRVSAWDTLLKARAIENLAYTVGLNRVGEDGMGIEYNGHSGVYDPKGQTLYFGDKEEIISTTLSGEELLRYRDRFPSHLDADNFGIL